LSVELGEVVCYSLDGSATFLDCFPSAMEVEQAQACEARSYEELGRLARQSASRDPDPDDIHRGRDD
jgi:hypothetical protein